MGIRLTEDEAWEVLAHAHTGIMTTLKADGWPVTLPVWFVALDRALYVRTPAKAKKLARIRRDPRASFLVEDGEKWAELRAVHLQVSVELIEDALLRERVAAAIEEKYAAFRTDASAMPQATRDQYAAYAFLKLVPLPRILTWDNRRIPLGRG